MSDRLILLYDKDCGFCRHWISVWESITSENVVYYPGQDFIEQFPIAAKKACTESVQLIENGTVIATGAEAICIILYGAEGGYKFPLWAYKKIPFMGRIMESSYQKVAQNRGFFSKLTRIIWGEKTKSSYTTASRLMMQGLGWVYVIAFVSLLVQVKGLFGTNGIIPISAWLEPAKTVLGYKIITWVPSLFIINASIMALQGVCILGILSGLMMALSKYKRTAAVIAWICYLSFVSAGSPFMHFESDRLLLEVGFLAFFIQPQPSKWVRWAYLILLCRIFFLSGLTQILSGTISWTSLSAFKLYLWTQPLPHIGSWISYQLPSVIQKTLCAGILMVEFLLPFGLFLTQKKRYIAVLSSIAVMILMILMGNTGLFSILVILIALWGLNDAFFYQFLPKLTQINPETPIKKIPFESGILCLLIGLSISSELSTLKIARMPYVIHKTAQTLKNHHVFGHYTLLEPVLRHRHEILFQGSEDGIHWKSYKLNYSPQDPTQFPKWVLPHQPRLDLQLKLATLSPLEHNKWVESVMDKLSKNTPETLAFFQNNPFKTKPPLYIRAYVYAYKMNTWQQYKQSGRIWSLEKKGSYSPAFYIPPQLYNSNQNR